MDAPLFQPHLHPHRRFNPLTGTHVLVSPQRNRRPWQGAQHPPQPRNGARHDPQCYLCPGNARIGGQHNADYRGAHVFPNDFPALLADAAEAPLADNAFFTSEPVAGEARVICFSPDHSLSLPELPVAAIADVVRTWRDQTLDLGMRWAWVQVFENKGEMMGCSNPHPHGQVWASDFIPDEPAREDERQRAYFAQRGQPLLLDYVQAEIEAGERTVVETAHWLAVVPWWAAWPFETLLLPKAPLSRMSELDPARASDLALAVKRLTTRYDNLFRTSFPYSMGWHGAPFDALDPQAWTLHAHFHPPLLRSASVRKFMVGFEMLGEAQRDLTPEQAAAMLRAVPDDRHYTEEAA
ncbi:UDP-glucose--hexose-1-phosphate uridylyltransferase [Roseateles violae]|uniref:Galactose-1-phosphate uridylyltransferase n=1 Tax=Roseateles violae TaxID=3058042 RepID=A0ABT8DLU0_9BURK|nr:UDP-glucose--hexose-1-phosphate uridylyltransferase [Pelomonas sp. PFR6]MDN3919376.1 UDP-glucose--hexose-1-phosphate uridylyltransferase [Pelomonas sp. PFR6]